MRDIDALIGDALDQEERDLLARIGDEPGFVRQAFGLFGGPTGWANIVLAVAQLVMFVGGIWAAWHFFEAADPLTALRWGLPAATLLIMAMVTKMVFLPVMYTQQVMRELKRFEVLMASRKA
ncbi:DUF6768 family protein [Sphingomonas sp.]|uniref:DUF6768 family protein n=1 Tax=Sphingomonas sp. TaxID=28214 RepID=UPI001ED2BAEA|nr:DUF6768 family protein [Sphingomonas sp.]MBX3594572.1 hypothetical protein [Sphingomonas sp.]